MTQEEKAKRYDEAIKAAKEWYNDPHITIGLKGNLEDIFHELKESDDEKIRKKLIENFKWLYGDYPETNKWGKDDDLLVKDIIAWLEKQSGQKTSDNVDPKFKVGDWITNGEYTWKVKDIKSLDYILQSQDGHIVDDTISCVDEHFRLWTITDAKEGDVLTIGWLEDNNLLEKIMIFKKYHNKGVEGLYSMPCVEGYGNTFKNGKLILYKEPLYSKTWTCNLHPATKEQRDALEKVMADAGYISYSDKNEIGKIGNETEIPFGANDSELQESTYYIPKGFHAEVDENKVVIKKGENPAWSEDDEANFNEALSYIKDDALKEFIKSFRPQSKQEWSEDDKNFIIDWLKSIKDRITNKQRKNRTKKENN